MTVHGLWNSIIFQNIISDSLLPSTHKLRYDAFRKKSNMWETETASRTANLIRTRGNHVSMVVRSKRSHEFCRKMFIKISQTHMKTTDKNLFLIKLIYLSQQTYHQRHSDISAFLKIWNKIQTRFFAEYLQATAS